MTRRGLGALELEHETVDATTLTRGTAPPRIRAPAVARSSNTKSRSATASQAYKRKDGTKMRRLTANLSSVVISRLEKHLLAARQRGIARNEWIEAALDHAVQDRWMPQTAAAPDAEGEGEGEIDVSDEP